VVYDDFKVQLTHTGNERLLGLIVETHAERGIFFGQLVEGHA